MMFNSPVCAKIGEQKKRPKINAINRFFIDVLTGAPAPARAGAVTR
jgi:hypothetical protein